MYRGLSLNTLVLYNLFLLIGGVWICWKYKHNGIALLIILLFFNGFFADLGETVQNIYKIIIFFWSFYLFIKLRLSRYLRKYAVISIFFSLYIFFFIFNSLYFNNDSAELVLSQAFVKYMIPFVFLLVFAKLMQSEKNSVGFNLLFKRLIILQVYFTLLKIVVVGDSYEGLVGSLTGLTGGGAGTSMPLLFLCWFALNTNMDINKKGVFFLLALLLIGLMTGKRAVFVLFPVLFIGFSLYVAKRKYSKKILSVLILAPVFLYLGMRLTPTLNPENKVWGRFDLIYAWNYGVDYTFGKENEEGEREVGQGRAGANMLIWKMITTASLKDSRDWFGFGAEYIYGADYQKYRNSDYYMGVAHRGALTGFGMIFFSLGISGLLFFLFFLISLFQLVKYRRLRIVLLGYVLFDFVFYNATVTTFYPALLTFLIFLIFYSNKQFNKNGRYMGNKEIRLFSLNSNSFLRKSLRMNLQNNLQK